MRMNRLKISMLAGAMALGLGGLQAQAGLDESLGGGTRTGGTAAGMIMFTKDGKILMRSNAADYNGTTLTSKVFRLHEDGRFDSSFNASGRFAGDFYLYAINPTNGNLLLGWRNGQVPTNNGTAITTSAGAGLAWFSPNMDSMVAGTNSYSNINVFEFISPSNLTLDGQGFVLSGYNSSYDTAYLVKINLSGLPDPDFSIRQGIGADLGRVKELSDGKLLVINYGATYEGRTVNALFKIHPNGALDTTFNTPLTGYPEDFVLLPDGKILVAGSALQYNSQAVPNLIRLNADGTRDLSFNSGGTGPSEEVWNVLLLPNNAGLLLNQTDYDNTETYNGQTTGALAILNMDGSFNRAIGGVSRRSCFLDPVGRVWLSRLDEFNGQTINNPARLRLSCATYGPGLALETCSGYTGVGGQVYTQTGGYPDTLGNNAAGCDSIRPLYLVIKDVDTQVVQGMDSLTATASNATFQWLDCNNNNAPIAGATSAVFVPTASGNYAVSVTQDGCSEVSACVQLNLTSTSVLEGALPIKLYPNPTTGLLQLETAVDLESAEVLNLLGQSLQLLHSLPAGQHSLSLDNLPKGSYLLRLQTQDGAVSLQRVVLQ